MGRDVIMNTQRHHEPKSVIARPEGSWQSILSSIEGASIGSKEDGLPQSDFVLLRNDGYIIIPNYNIYIMFFKKPISCDASYTKP